MARKGGVLENLALRSTQWAGSSWAFAIALGSILAWAATGPLFGFSDTWQLVINTSTTIVTFLMVFLIQRSQNKDSQAIQLKLNELVASVHGASNRLINVEDLSEREVESLHRHYCKLVELARADRDLTESHSVEEAAGRHRSKRGGRRADDAAHRGEAGPGAPGTNGRHPNGSPRPGPGGESQAPPAPAATRGAGPDAAGAELAEFLAAAEKLRGWVGWHQRQAAAHQRSVAELKKVLARHGVRLKALAQAAAEDRPGAGSRDDADQDTQAGTVIVRPDEP